MYHLVRFFINIKCFVYSLFNRVNHDDVIPYPKQITLAAFTDEDMETVALFTHYITERSQNHMEEHPRYDALIALLFDIRQKNCIDPRLDAIITMLHIETEMDRVAFNIHEVDEQLKASPNNPSMGIIEKDVLKAKQSTFKRRLKSLRAQYKKSRAKIADAMK